MLETVQRTAPFGVRFWDAAARSSAIEGLEVDVFPDRRPHLRSRALAGPSGVYSVRGLAGLGAFETSDAPPDALWSAPKRDYRVEVRDPQGRFLPMQFHADLPARGLFGWRAPWFSPPRAISLPTEPGSPPALLLDRVPLFSSPSRLVIDPLAVAYAQLAEAGTGAPCPWTLLQVTVGDVRGLGLSDREGRVAVLFPYPPPPRPTLSSPPAPRNDFQWDVEISAFSSPPHSPAASRIPEVAELESVLAQLYFPRAVLDSFAPPPVPFGPQRLQFRVPLVLRSAAVPASLASSLILSSA